MECLNAANKKGGNKCVPSLLIPMRMAKKVVPQNMATAINAKYAFKFGLFNTKTGNKD